MDKILAVVSLTIALGGLWFMVSDGAFEATELELRVRLGMVDPRAAAASLVGRAFASLVTVFIVMMAIEGCFLMLHGAPLGGHPYIPISLIMTVFDSAVVGCRTIIRAGNIMTMPIQSERPHGAPESS